MEEEILFEKEEENLEEKFKKLREKLKKCQKDKEEYLAGWQRAKADFINARREEEEKRKEIIKLAEENLIQELLSILDGFDNAFSDESWEKLDKNWQDGLKYLYNQLMNILKKHNVTLIESVNKKFDPAEHESIEENDVDDPKKDGVVVSEARKGYKIHQKVLRPAQVRVGKYKQS